MKNEYKVDLARSPDGGSTGQERKPRRKDQTARADSPNRPSGFHLFGQVAVHVSRNDLLVFRSVSGAFKGPGSGHSSS